jgi:hypothetical protein
MLIAAHILVFENPLGSTGLETIMGLTEGSRCPPIVGALLKGTGFLAISMCMKNKWAS